MVGENGQQRVPVRGVVYYKVDFDRIARAMRLAMEAHHCQPRKSDGTPYIFHPIAVGRKVAEALARSGSYNSDVECAAILHDVCEDGGVSLDMIEKWFGKDVAKLVACLSEDKSGTWFQRKMRTVEEIGDWDENAQLIKLADIIDNLTSLAQQLAQEVSPELVWSRFNEGREFQWWYHHGMWDNISGAAKLASSYRYLVNHAFELQIKIWPDLMKSSKWEDLNCEVAKFASGVK